VDDRRVSINLQHNTQIRQFEEDKKTPKLNLALPLKLSSVKPGQTVSILKKNVQKPVGNLSLISSNNKKVKLIGINQISNSENEFDKHPHHQTSVSLTQRSEKSEKSKKSDKSQKTQRSEQSQSR
jgi:hypothetical protein